MPKSPKPAQRARRVLIQRSQYERRAQNRTTSQSSIGQTIEASVLSFKRTQALLLRLLLQRERRPVPAIGSVQTASVASRDRVWDLRVRSMRLVELDASLDS